MILRAPNIAVFVVAFCLALLGVLAAMPIELPIPGIFVENAAWYIFLAWFLLAAGSALPAGEPRPADEQKTDRVTS